MMNAIIKIPQRLRTELWWLMITVDFNYSRIAIAEHEVEDNCLTLWLEDKQDYKNTLEECVEIKVPFKQFARLIRSEQLNSYESVTMHHSKKFLYKKRAEINDAISWYLYDASATEQLWAREALVKHMLTQLIENEIFAC